MRLLRGRVRAYWDRNWDEPTSRPVIVYVAVWRLAVGFSAARPLGYLFVEVYLGWWSVTIGWERYEEGV